jgi:hypothetical protein
MVRHHQPRCRRRATNTVAISAEAVVESSGTAHAFAAPEPSTLFLVPGCLVGLFVAGRKRIALRQ